jgi:hypothetical protein
MDLQIKQMQEIIRKSRIKSLEVKQWLKLLEKCKE